MSVPILAMITVALSAVWPGMGGFKAAQAGVIQGTVRYSGRAISRDVRVTRDREVCDADGVTDSSVLTGDEGGLGGVVVSLRGFTAGPMSGSGAGLHIQLAQCGFQPRVASLPAGARLTITSADPIEHQLKATIEGREVFRWKMPGPQQLSKRVRGPGLVQLECLRHRWSRAWVWVFEHPYHTVTDAAGGYRIADVPRGAYTVEFWHERFSGITREVDVGAGVTAGVDVRLGD